MQMMCRVLEVVPSGSYDWLLQPLSNRALADARLLRLIRAPFVGSHGEPRLQRSLSLRKSFQTARHTKSVEILEISRILGRSRISLPTSSRKADLFENLGLGMAGRAKFHFRAPLR